MKHLTDLLLKSEIISYINSDYLKIMAFEIKEISKFSEDAIGMAYEQLPESEKELMNKSLKTMLEKLGTKNKKPVTNKGINMSDGDIFLKEILPRINMRISEIENMELERDGVQIGVDFSEIKTDFEHMRLEQLQIEHTKILKLESSLKISSLVIQFIRGKFYLFAKEILKTSGNDLETAVEQVFGVSYRTFLRYATLANMLFCFPRLVLCELSFTQILLHQKRLLKYLKSNEGRELRDRLSFPVVLNTMGATIIIERCDVEVLAAKFNVGPDWEFHDKYDKSRLPSDADVHNIFDGATRGYREADEQADLEYNL